MIYITTAMYWEASPFISYLGLKRDNDITKFQVFSNDEVTLVITGVGIVPSAIATTYMISNRKVNPNDLFVNIGICGSLNKEIEKGSIILCNKIINHDSKKTFYPDILFKHPFIEGALESFSNVVNGNTDLPIEGNFVDMEGAGAYQAANVFFKPHQISVIKIVSDYLDTEDVTSEGVTKLIGERVHSIVDWLKEIKEGYVISTSIFTEKEEKILEIINEGLKLSVTMGHQLKQLAKQYKVRSGNLVDILTPYLNIQCKSKNEGKMYFAKLKEQLMAT